MKTKLIIVVVLSFLLFGNLLFSQDNESTLQEKQIIQAAVNAIESLHMLNDYLIAIEIVTLKGELEMDGRLSGLCLFRDFNNSIIVIKSPKKDNGKALLNSSDVFYIYFPTIRKTQPVNASSKLFGNFNVSDVLKPPFKENYSSRYLNSDGDIHRIEFTALNDKVSYYKQIIYYDNNKKSVNEIKFYSKSDKLIKTAYYEEFITIGNDKFVSSIRIKSVLGQTSILKFSNHKKQSFSDKYFTPAGLRIVAESY